MSNRSTVMVTLLLLVSTFAVLLVVNREYYFATPLLEQGDLAANALQIQRAKNGLEIYGNYSRFHFNHPGPAFFYVYALGELVLHDWLHLVPSPHSAHSIAGMALQGLFFSLALAIFSARFGSATFVPLALVLGAIHFGMGQYAFTSLWAPHAPLMPFLCFLVACCSVSSGGGEHLPVAVVAGGFLVHGHVAQPLFVVTLLGLAYALLWVRARRAMARKSPVGVWPTAHAVAAVGVAVFVTPLGIDWISWSHSNLARVISHLEMSSGDRKSVRQSILYLLSFFSYRHDQDTLLQRPWPTSFLRDDRWCYAGWIFAGAVLSWRLRGVRRLAGVDARSADRWRFTRNVVLFWAAAGLLCVQWGTMQTGAMFEFNGHFYFGWIFVLVLLLAGSMPTCRGPWSRFTVSAVLCCVALAIAARVFKIPGLPLEDRCLDLREATSAILAADPKPSSPKVIAFPPDRWPTVASALVAIVRAGGTFCVDPQWGFVFGRQRELGSQVPTSRIDEYTVWRFLHNAPADAGFQYRDDVRVALSPGRLDPAGGEIDCSRGGDLERYQVAGFQPPDPGTSDDGFHFTVNREAVLQIESTPADRDVVVGIRAGAFVLPAMIPAQPMELWVNDARIGLVSLDGAVARDVSFQIPAEVWNRRRSVLLVMRFPAARSYEDLGVNADSRVFGWMIRRIWLHYAN